MAKKTNDPRETSRIVQVDDEIQRLRFPSGGPLDRPLRITLLSGAALDGQVTGGTVQQYPQEVDHEAAEVTSDLLSGEVVLTDPDGNIHSIDLLDIESVCPAPDPKGLRN